MQATAAHEVYLDVSVFERIGARTEKMTQQVMEVIGRYSATNPWFVLFIGKELNHVFPKSFVTVHSSR